MLIKNQDGNLEIGRIFSKFVNNSKRNLCQHFFIILGLRFFFYSNDHEPMHVHVSNADGEAKFKIDPIFIIENKGIKQRDLWYAEAAIEENKEVIIERWNEFFKNNR